MDLWRTRALALMKEAEERTCLNDWGEKEAVTSTLALAIRSLEEMLYHATPEAIQIHKREIKDRLQFRLKLIKEIHQNPEVSAIQIKSPVFIIGNPRTGSTLLHNLLSQDPLTRCPLLYELKHPSSDVPTESRIATAAHYVQEWKRVAPLFCRMHPMHPEAADECPQGLAADMFFLPLLLSSSFRTYFTSQPRTRLAGTYKFHKKMMQLFEHQNPKDHQHWTFKSPSHTLNLDLIMKVYPDAKFIWIHRDPVEVMSSYAQLWDSYCGWMFSDQQAVQDDKIARTRSHLNVYSGHLNKLCKQLEELGKGDNPPHVVHCYYNDLKQDPETTIRSIYSQLGREFTQEFRERLETKFNQMEISLKKSSYSHSLQGTGLTKECILTAYSPYLKSYSYENYHSVH